MTEEGEVILCQVFLPADTWGEEQPGYKVLQRDPPVSIFSRG